MGIAFNMGVQFFALTFYISTATIVYSELQIRVRWEFIEVPIERIFKINVQRTVTSTVNDEVKFNSKIFGKTGFYFRNIKAIACNGKPVAGKLLQRNHFTAGIGEPFNRKISLFGRVKMIYKQQCVAW